MGLYTKTIVFSEQYDYSNPMDRKLFYLILPLFLTGCVGSFILGETEYLDECYPDIRTVPERTEALCPRGLHEGEEKASRSTELKHLTQDWEQITARDKALREKVFPLKSEQ